LLILPWSEVERAKVKIRGRGSQRVFGEEHELREGEEGLGVQKG